MNLTNTTTVESLLDSRPGILYIISYCILACIVGFTLNILIVFAIRYGVHTSSKVKVQLINLAIADCLFAFAYPVYSSTIFLLDGWSIGLTQCYFYVFVFKAALSASPLCSVAISLERLVIIFFPFRAKRYRRCHKLLVIALIWFCSCLLSVDNIIYVQVAYEQDGEIYCKDGTYHHDGELDVLWKWVVPTVEIIIPFATVLLAYALVCIRFCLRGRSTLMRKSSKRSKKGTDKLLGVLAVDAFISLVPSLGFYLYLYAYKPPVEGNSDATIQDVLEALYVTSAYSMPLIHLAFNPYIRKDFLLLFQRLRCKKTAEVIKKFPDNQSKRPTIATVTDNIV